MTLFYIDPGTGMIIVQLIVAAFASIAAFSKKIRDKIKSFLKENEIYWFIQLPTRAYSLSK